LDFTIDYEGMMEKKAIVLANGSSPTVKAINYFRAIGYDTLICADGGANTARQLKIIPSTIIGDMDSISDETKNYFKDKSDFFHYSRQDDTDVEKTLKYLVKRKYRDVILLGAAGNRLDHTICNLGIILKFYEEVRISILYKKSFLRPYSGAITIPTIKGETISLYGFDNKTTINSEGLKYPLVNTTLPFGEKESTSNVALKNEIRLEINYGVIFVIRNFKLLKKHDLI
jgi:thiamine pyrophosphokinase